MSDVPLSGCTLPGHVGCTLWECKPAPAATLLSYEGPVCERCAHRHRADGPCASHVWGDECAYQATETCPVTTRPPVQRFIDQDAQARAIEAGADPVDYVDDPAAPADRRAPYDGPPADPAVDIPSITCPRCSRTSYNPNDVREGYCGACHDWTSPPRPNLT